MSVSAATDPPGLASRWPPARERIARYVRGVSNEARWLWFACAVFVLVSVWWLTQDNRVPDFDSGIHMVYAIVAWSEMTSGHLTQPFTDYNTYPPLVHLLGTLTIYLGGIHPMAMILASNIVFVPLLAFGCYGVGKVVAGPRAGLLAGLFALGTPMFVSMMHGFDLDPAEAAMVAVSVWAILESRRFERIGVSVLAGVLCGLALLTKETAVVFLAGVLAVVLLRGGWRHWRGLLGFVFGLENVAGPWYIYHATQLLSTLTSIGGLAPNSLQAPPRWSARNAGWYVWNLLNEQTLTVFAVLFLIGVAIALWRCVRYRITPQNVYPELLGGGLVSYLGMTYLTHKDPRYTLPALVYVAVLATSWIVTIQARRIRLILSGTVIALSAVYFAGMSFGIGGAVRIALPGAENNILYQNQLTLYETAGWVRGGPQHDAAVQTLLRGLRREGINAIGIDPGSNELDFNANGLNPLAASVGIGTELTPVSRPDGVLLFLHARQPSIPRPCQRLNDGLGIYVVRGVIDGFNPQLLRNPANSSQRYLFICPGRSPLLYPPPVKGG
jgi:4-amino-4-deoxy-L-arabinose transferase-like glycosyltransferase